MDGRYMETFWRPPVRRAAMAGALALAGAGASAQELVWARYGDADSLDPHRATSTPSMQVWDQIYDTLLSFDMEGTPGPNMAKSWEVSEDGLEYTFTLNEGIKCHDGTDFDANDVKFTIDRAFGDTPSLTRTSWGPITDVTVVDPLTVTVTLGSTFGAFLPFLADSFSVDDLRHQHGRDLRVVHGHRHRAVQPGRMGQG